MTRFLLVAIHNCALAIAISVFFAAARVPALHHASGAVDALTGAMSRVAEQSVRPPNSPGCDRNPQRVCRMTDAGP